jgi:hypothetical protein
MQRRGLLVAVSGLLAGSGCTTNTADSSSSSSSPSSSPQTSTSTETPSSTDTEGPAQTRNQTTEPTETPNSPYTFALLNNQDSITHQFTFTAIRTASGSVVYETRQSIGPGETVEITDEWRTESGEYEIRGKTEAGNSARTRIEADSNWACDHFLQFTIGEDGEVSATLAVGSGKTGCDTTATDTASPGSDTPE